MLKNLYKSFKLFCLMALTFWAAMAMILPLGLTEATPEQARYVSIFSGSTLLIFILVAPYNKKIGDWLTDE